MKEDVGCQIRKSMQTRSGWYRRKGQVCRISIKLNKPLPYKPT